MKKNKETLLRVCLFIAAIINLTPATLAFLPVKISSSYGIGILDANYELLLRHRAVLFGIVGGLLLYSSITKKNYSLAATIGLVSMVSFIILYGLIPEEINPELHQVMIIDIVGAVILAFGFVLYKFQK